MTVAFTLADQFAALLGTRRGRTRAHSRLEPMDGDAFSALLNMPMQGEFETALRFVHDHAHELGRSPASQADMLAMALGTWMSSKYHSLPEDLGVPFGYRNGLDRKSFRTGVQSRIGDRMEQQLTSCPPDRIAEWAETFCEQHAVGALTERLMLDDAGVGVAARILTANELPTVAAKLHGNTAVFERVAAVACEADTPAPDRRRAIKRILLSA